MKKEKAQIHSVVLQLQEKLNPTKKTFYEYQMKLDKETKIIRSMKCEEGKNKMDLVENYKILLLFVTNEELANILDQGI